MPKPKGSLTAAQHEIMEVIWETGESGATVTEIWAVIAQQRNVTRTTVLNQVDRLEKRGWLKRQKHEGVFRYVGALDRAETAQCLAEGFVADFFGGSASELVMSLLGSKRLKRDDIQRLRKLLDLRLSKKKPKE